MHQQARGALHAYRAFHGQAGAAMPPSRLLMLRASPRLMPLPGDGRSSVRRWRVIGACAICALAGLAVGTLLPHSPARVSAADATPASSPAAAVTSRATPASERTIVYQSLPVTTGQLSTAIRMAARFTAAYCTYSYAQPPAAWLARLHHDTTATLQAALTQVATDPALLQLRARRHTTAACTLIAASIRDIASTSVTVVVTARQATRTSSQSSTTSRAYALTIPAGSRWAVYDIQPATAGQAGGSLP
jgi:hypothetical protein